MLVLDASAMLNTKTRACESTRVEISSVGYSVCWMSWSNDIIIITRMDVSWDDDDDDDDDNDNERPS